VGTQVNVLDPKFISQKYSDGRSAILRMAAFFKKYTEGFETAVISSIAPMLGVRETREIEAEYTLTVYDLINFTKFDDGISKSGYGVDVHGAKTGEKYKFAEVPKAEKYYEIPVRSLIVKGIDNLTVAGRCIGTDFVTQSSTRQQHACRATGEVCALIVKQCIDKSLKKCKEVDGAEIRKTMRKAGVSV
jgi:hypothetical protein